jgi:hypothetical protein
MNDRDLLIKSIIDKDHDSFNTLIKKSDLSFPLKVFAVIEDYPEALPFYMNNTTLNEFAYLYKEAIKHNSPNFLKELIIKTSFLSDLNPELFVNIIYKSEFVNYEIKEYFLLLIWEKHEKIRETLESTNKSLYNYFIRKDFKSKVERF